MILLSLVMDLEKLLEYLEQICKRLLSLYIMKEQLMESSIKKIKDISDQSIGELNKIRYSFVITKEIYKGNFI